MSDGIVILDLTGLSNFFHSPTDAEEVTETLNQMLAGPSWLKEGDFDKLNEDFPQCEVVKIGQQYFGYIVGDDKEPGDDSFNWRALKVVELKTTPNPIKSSLVPKTPLTQAYVHEALDTSVFRKLSEACDSGISLLEACKTIDTEFLSDGTKLLIDTFVNFGKQIEQRMQKS
jgi:hypothetical protein